MVVEFIVDTTTALHEEKIIGNVIIVEDVISCAKPYCKVNPLLNSDNKKETSYYIHSINIIFNERIYCC